MRVKNAIKNTITNIICNLLIMVVGLVSQVIFIRILGAEYLGVNGLFTNILSILSIVELGIGNAIIYNLYKPLAKDDAETVKSLIYFYKKAYSIIAIIVLILGMCILPFLDFFIGKTTVTLNLRCIYILFLLQTVSSYILSYRTSIFNASQRNYVVKINNLFYRITVNFLQLIILYITKNYYLYLTIAIVTQLLFNFLINKKALIQYPYLREKNVNGLSKEIENDIFVKIKALFFHKIGGFFVNCTDNIIISKFFNVLTVGLYSNYYLIINSTTTLFNQIISGASASIGNLLVTESKEKSFDVFKKIRFLNFWLAVFSSSCILCLIQNFITIWIGEKYLLNIYVVIILVVNFYQQLMRNTYNSFKDAAGIWVEDKFIPIIESILNIIFSIICLKIFGLAGVFLGTIVSGFALWFYSYPIFVYKKLFERSYYQYIIETIAYFILFLIIDGLTFLTINIFDIFVNTYIKLLFRISICIILPNLLLIIIFYKNSNFIYYKNLIKQFFRKKNN